MRKWLILLAVALFSSSAMAGQPKLRGPSRSLNSRPSISSMRDRGKPRVRVRTDARNRRNRRGLSFSRNRPVKSIIYKDHYYRPPQPIIVIVHVLPKPIPKPKPSSKIVRESSHVTIFIKSKSSPNSKRFNATSRGGLIIFPEKSKP